MEAGDLICVICGADTATSHVEAPHPDHEVNDESQETVIAGWRVLRQISSSVGILDRYLVEEPGTERHAILTLYYLGAEPDPAIYDVIKRLPKEHIPDIYATGRWNERAFEVTEELMGGSLADLGIVATDISAIRRIVYELGKALNSLGEVGLRHRDVHPGTLLVRNRDPLDLVIGGFGSSRLSESDLDIVSPLEITRYTAPEAVAGGVAAASDWWSLGMVLLEQITGGACFAGVNQHAYLIHVLANGVPIPEDIAPDIDLLLRGLLARDRNQRWKWEQVQAWLDGKPVSAPPRVSQSSNQQTGPAITLAGKRYYSGLTYALAAAEAANWNEARDQLIRGAVTSWAQESEFPATMLAGLRRVARHESVNEDFRLLAALKVLNSEMPPIHQGDIVTPKWLLEHPLEGYELITGPIPDFLEQLGMESWLYRLKVRSDDVRSRAANLDVELDEDTLRINLLSTSKAKLAAEWEERRKLLPDTDRHGLLNLIERRTVSEEDLIIILSAAIGQFRSCDSIIKEAKELARANRVDQFDEYAAQEVLNWPRSEILQTVGERIEGFARCNNTALDEWADHFRLEKRIPLAKALVLLSVPQNQWQEPQKQQYISQILDFFEKKIVTSVMRGPLVRMTIGKTTARVDLHELGTTRLDAASLLDHLLLRNELSVTLDPAAFDIPESTTEVRMLNLQRHTQLYKRDTGIDGLYMGFPFLLTREDNTSTRIAPVLLWPAHIHHELGTRGRVTIAYDSDRDEVRLNPALEGIIGPEGIKRWRETAQELLGRSALRAPDVLDAFGTLATPRSRVLSSLPGPKTQVRARSLELECSAVLFHVTFIGQAIGEDIRQLKAMSPGGTGLEAALRLNGAATAASPNIEKTRELDRYFTVHSDPSQEAAVLQARLAPGLLVEGPPGTGKSQTIVNMVCDAIGQRRSLLIVCQKHAALEVVHKRLVAEGLGNRLVMINDINRDRNSIIKGVREQLEELTRRRNDPATTVRRRREEIAARIEALEATLDEHHQALHRVDEKIGISYRMLLGELIRLETPQPPIVVPALRQRLQEINTGQLATLEEEIAPITRHWLPSRYEGSPLSNLQSFATDQATLDDFIEAFERLSKAEYLRAEVLQTNQATFEIDDPAPHKSWLNTYGKELLDLPDPQRILLARWLPLFRGIKDVEMPGLKAIHQLLELRDALLACRAEDYDERLSPALCNLSPTKLEKLRRRSEEAVSLVSFVARLNPFRLIRIWRAAAYLRSIGDQASQSRMTALLTATKLEQRWRPLRSSLADVHRNLQLQEIATDAGPTLLSTVETTLANLQKTAILAENFTLAPWPGRIDQVASIGTKDALLKLFAEYDSAFARCEARETSRAALEHIKNWMSQEWVAQCATAITVNEPNTIHIHPIENSLTSLAPYQYFRSRADRLSSQALDILSVLRTKEVQLESISPADLEMQVRRILSREARLGWKRAIEKESPELQLETSELETKISSLEKLDEEIRNLNRELLRDDFDLKGVRPSKEWEDITRLTGQRARRLREFIELGTGLGLMKLRPVWLMNPDVASRVLPLKSALFDTIIYDEASQMPVEFALPSLFRAKISIVSGDEKQMPPTAFFSSKVENDEAQTFDGAILDEDATEEERETFDDTWNRREIKDCPDLLQLARTSLPSARLQIHYRSAYRELINYSNAAFYGNDLSVPVRHSESTIRAAKPIEMIQVNGTYQDQTNPAEAVKVVELLAELWKQPYQERPSVGVVTFNRKQADIIEEALELRAEEDPEFREAYRLESQRDEDGEDMGVFVKNVENVQGDERDMIIFSSTFGRNKQGTFLRNFGVLGQKGGERRLNVAITRSRKKIVMVTSMPIEAISDVLTTKRSPSTPRDFLQGYMEYARTVSAGEFGTARTLLNRWAVANNEVPATTRRTEDGFSEAVVEYVKSLGHIVKSTTENDAFGLDFAIEHPSTGLFAIGIECDAPRHPLLERARAREVWRPSVLRRAVPIIHRVSSQGWYQDGEQERSQLREALDKALQAEMFQ
jgi:hypothetical protein